MSVKGSDYAKEIAHLASTALRDEAQLTPKPGLVDRRGSGSHTDMTLSLFEKSATVLEATFFEIALASFGQKIDSSLRSRVGALGRAGENRMLLTTGGVNTHRGAIWTLGLLCAAAASLKGEIHDEKELLSTAAALAAIADPALVGVNLTSHGSTVLVRYKKTGAREEAQAGFPHIAKAGLPTLRSSLASGASFCVAAVNALLSIMATLSDTCVLTRAGLEGLDLTQKGAARILALGGFGTKAGEAAYRDYEKQIREMNISPGGAADLLAGTFFVDRLLKMPVLTSEK